MAISSEQSLTWKRNKYMYTGGVTAEKEVQAVMP